MTAADYATAYDNARRKTPTLIRGVMREILETYKAASKDVAAAILAGSGDLASDRLNSVLGQLNEAQVSIAQAVQTGVVDGLDRVTGMYSAIDEKILNQIFADTTITPEGIRSMVVGINTRLITEMVSVMGQDGYVLSDRCWQVGADYREQVRRLITSGTAQGRSLADIARDLGDYTTGGVEALPGGYTQAKYGDLVVKNVDWRALRLVRSEVSQAQKLAAVAQGESNPGGTGWYDWLRVNTQQHYCVCPDLAANGPYRAENVPDQPHPACFCVVRQRLKPLDEVTADIERWAAGESVDYLDEWYATKYQA